MLKIQVPGKYIFAIHISNRSCRTLTKSEKEPTYQFGSITQLFHKIQYSNSRVLSTEVVWVEGIFSPPLQMQTTEDLLTGRVQSIQTLVEPTLLSNSDWPHTFPTLESWWWSSLFYVSEGFVYEREIKDLKRAFWKLNEITQRLLSLTRQIQSKQWWVAHYYCHRQVIFYSFIWTTSTRKHASVVWNCWDRNSPLLFNTIFMHNYKPTMGVLCPFY